MRRTSLIIIFTAIIFAFSTASAQDKMPGWLVFHQNKVDNQDMGKVAELDSLAIPVLQSLVDEGYLFNFGRMDHAWGDEWNLNYYFIADDAESFFDFWNEYVKRINEKHPEAFKSFRKYFKEHKDNMYSIQLMKFKPPAEGEDIPRWIVLNQNKISLADFEKFDELDKKVAPILDQLVEEGLLNGYGRLNHAWGDEWNLNYYMISKDKDTFNKAWNEYISRISKKHPGLGQEFANLTKAHKDNMYYHVFTGKPKSQ